MKLYALSLTAQHIINDQLEIRIHPLLVSGNTQEEILEESRKAAVTIFPPSEGWDQHQAVALEIEQGMLFDDGRRLTWQLEKVEEDKEESDG